jgi:hypothetical protein
MRALALAVVLAAVAPGRSLANGRPPTTNGVHFRPGDSHSVYVASTFGLLISHDDGCSFHWVCEDNLGYGGTFDPKYRIAPDGTIFATTFNGLRVSRDGGCSFATATAALAPSDPARIADKWIDAIDIGPTGEVWVATADNGKPNDVYRSTDNGLTFAPRGMQSPTIWWKSIRVAPSRASRIYATGYQVAGVLPDAGQMPPTTHFLTSDDDGATWTRSALSGVQLGVLPLVYASGVDPGNPDIVIMLSTGANPPSGDRLYRSSDGGVTWAEVLATQGAVLDVSLTDAGDVLVATLGGNAFRSTDHGTTFAPLVGPPQLACVGQGIDGQLYGCGANWEPDFKAVARSSDGAAWNQVFRFVELAGPLECPAGTAEHDTCGGQWAALKDQFGATGPTTGACAAPQPDVTPPDVTMVSPPLVKSSGGCCDAGGSSPGELGTLALLALSCGGATLRRRRR